eukprot:6222754-Alexandrium_andersonii.AAC.1
MVWNPLASPPTKKQLPLSAHILAEVEEAQITDGGGYGLDRSTRRHVLVKGSEPAEFADPETSAT